MQETTQSLIRLLTAFLLVLLVMSVIYPEGFDVITDAFAQNLQIILLLVTVWVIFSILKKKGD